MITITSLTKSLRGGGHRVDILNGIDLSIPDGQFVALTGPSGSGKTTLLGLIAGLDSPTSGSIVIDGEDIARMSEDALALLRARKFGFVFQNFHLIPTLTALENAVLPVELVGETGAEERARSLLAEVGLGERLGHYPAQLSGGEQQRLCLARAFINRPDYVLADEPTGNLDSRNSEKVLDLLGRLHAEHGATVLLVTHEAHVAARAQRLLALEDGRLVRDAPGNGKPS